MVSGGLVITPAESNERTEMANVELMERVLSQIESNLERWNQYVWREPQTTECGTAMCFAGWTAEIAGIPWASDTPWTAEYMHVLMDGQRVGVWEAAQKALGLDDDEANDLFDANNSIETLRMIVARHRLDEDEEVREAEIETAVSDWQADMLADAMTRARAFVQMGAE